MSNEAKELISKLAFQVDDVHNWFAEREEEGFTHYDAYFMYKYHFGEISSLVRKLEKLSDAQK